MNKPILIQGAENTEIDYLRSILNNVEEKQIGNHIFFIGQMDEYPVIVSKTNIGLINSAIATTIGIINFLPIAIINQGTAGGYGKNIHRGDIIIGEDYINLTSFSTEKRNEGEGFDIDNWKIKVYHDSETNNKNGKANKHLIELVLSQAKEYKFGKIYSGKIGSGDIWNREADRILYLSNKYDILCEDMETAATYTVANEFNVPIVGIRIISNNEVLNEEYKKDIALHNQKFVEKVVKKYIKELKNRGKK